MPVKKGLSPVQRTIRELRNQGCICDVCEKWVTVPTMPGGGYRKDLFDFIDIIALAPNGIVAIQACGQDFAAHKRKLLNNEYLPEWIKSGGSVQIWGWRKVLRQRGGKQKIWAARVEGIK